MRGGGEAATGGAGAGAGAGGDGSGVNGQEIPPDLTRQSTIALNQQDTCVEFAHA